MTLLLGAGLDFLGVGIDQVPRQLLEEILTSYPRLNFKSAFRDLLVHQVRDWFSGACLFQIANSSK